MCHSFSIAAIYDNNADAACSEIPNPSIPGLIATNVPSPESCSSFMRCRNQEILSRESCLGVPYDADQGYCNQVSKCVHGLGSN